MRHGRHGHFELADLTVGTRVRSHTCGWDVLEGSNYLEGAFEWRLMGIFSARADLMLQNKSWAEEDLTLYIAMMLIIPRARTAAARPWAGRGATLMSAVIMGWVEQAYHSMSSSPNPPFSTVGVVTSKHPNPETLRAAVLDIDRGYIRAIWQEYGNLVAIATRLQCAFEGSAREEKVDAPTKAAGEDRTANKEARRNEILRTPLPARRDPQILP